MNDLELQLGWPYCAVQHGRSDNTSAGNLDLAVCAGRSQIASLSRIILLPYPAVTFNLSAWIMCIEFMHFPNEEKDSQLGTSYL